MEVRVKGPGRASGGLFSGPAAFKVATSWGPWWALMAAVAIVLASLGVAIVLLAAGVVGGRNAIPGDSLGIGLLGAWQVSVIVLTLLAASWRGHASEVLALSGPPAGATAYASALGVLLLFQIVATGLEFAFIPEQMFHDLRQFVEPSRGPYWLLILVVIAVGAPLSEEMLFRGFLFPALSKWPIGARGAAVVTTGLWTLLHLGYSVFGLVEVFLVGLLFSWLLWRTGSLRVTILCHALYNGLIILVLRFAPLPAALVGG